MFSLIRVRCVGGAVGVYAAGESDHMAVPKRRHTNSRTGKRRSQDARKPRAITYCDQCSTAVPSHAVCPNCGYYMGRKVTEAKS